jgi:predicted SAM-dependent methyltransferase
MSAGAKSVVKTVVTAVNAPIGRRRLQRTLERTAAPLRVELGSNARRPGWVVTNVSWRARLHLDATEPWPMADGTVEVIFADNMIEHLPLAGARLALQHAHSALRPGGTIRLATPDVEAAARLYLGQNEAQAEALMEMHRRAGRVAEHSVDILRIPFAEHGHHVGYLYDEASLAAELKRAGFHGIRRCAPGESEIADLRHLENRTDAEAFVQLILEADA